MVVLQSILKGPYHCWKFMESGSESETYVLNIFQNPWPKQSSYHLTLSDTFLCSDIWENLMPFNKFSIFYNCLPSQLMKDPYKLSLWRLMKAYEAYEGLWSLWKLMKSTHSRCCNCPPIWSRPVGQRCFQKLPETGSAYEEPS